ncbi:MAG: peptidase M14 [Bacteroidia bacterium]|nr:peptidase M14 [Bacteroidia bacterium]
MEASRKIILIIFTLFSVTNLIAQEDGLYKRVKVFGSDRERSLMQKSGVDLDHPGEETEDFTTGEFSEWEMGQIEDLGLETEILIEDLETYYSDRNHNTCTSELLQSVPPGFNYGSMGGFLTLSETEAELDSLFLQYPNLITPKVSLGNSIENRPIWMVKISDNPESDENEPEVLYVGLHHAREPITVTELIFFMQYLLANYGSDPAITYMLQNRELYFVPVMNPDGYVYNEINNPQGGGMWRKNRRANADGTFGVDLNRNYGFQWGFDDIGSTPDPASDRYRGTAAFSEPETQAIRDFCLSRNFKTALNAHGYGNLLLHPWGFQGNTPCPDDLLYQLRGAYMTSENYYTYGQGPIILYGVNGDSNDWMYGEQSAKNKIMTVTPETGTPDDGFWPELNRIVPLCEEMLPVLMDNAWFAGEFLISNPSNGFTTSNLSFQFPVHSVNYGPETANNVTLQFISNNPYFLYSGTTAVNNLLSGASQTYYLSLTLAQTTPQDEVIEGVIRTTFSDGYYIDSVASFVYSGNTTSINKAQFFSDTYLYPNPNSGKCSVKLDGDLTADMYLEIRNIQNDIIKKIPVLSKNIDLSPIQPGMYFYCFRDQKHTGQIQKMWVEE